MPPTTTISTEKSISTETLACLIATLQKSSPTVKFDFPLMSRLSTLTNTPLTASALEHRFRAIKKRAGELLEEARRLEEGGGGFGEVPAGGRKRGVGKEASADAEGEKPVKKKAKGVKVKKDEGGADGDDGVA